MMDVTVQTPMPVATDAAGDTTAAPTRGGWAHYRLQPGLELIAKRSDGPGEPAGGFVFALRPLMAMRLNAQAFSILSALADDGATAEEAARIAGVSPVVAAGFLDHLAGRRLLVRTPPSLDHWPRISIIVAARGRHSATRTCVVSLLALDYAFDRREIIVVDDASEPPLAAALAGLPIRLIRLDRNIGQSAARNLAAAEAQGELLAFTDNDCIADPAWLRSLVPYFDDPSVAIVGGRVNAPPPTGTVAAFEAVRSPLDMGAIGSTVGPEEAVSYLPTCNFIVRRDTFLAAAGFDAEMRLGEDVDFTWRVLRTGARACYVPLAHVTHHHRERLGPLLRRRADYASSEADLQHRHPSGRRVMPMPRTSLLVLATLTALPLSAPLAAALAVLVATRVTLEVGEKHRRTRGLGMDLPASRIARGVVREHVASMYGLSANVIRYYGMPLLGLAALLPALMPGTAILFVLAPVKDYFRLKPACGLPAFIGLFWLEMAAYQLGVWRGCRARWTLRPLSPILRWRR